MTIQSSTLFKNFAFEKRVFISVLFGHYRVGSSSNILPN